jgi:hypothetical protein
MEVTRLASSTKLLTRGCNIEEEKPSDTRWLRVLERLNLIGNYPYCFEYW